MLVITFLVYGRTISYGFVWDDERSHLTAHKDLMEGNIGKLISKPYDGMYIPVTYLTWNAAKSFAKDGDKLNPKPFHSLNVLFHAANVVLLFLILNLLFGNSIAAFVGAALFGFHPLQVESVAWISEFRGVYSCFFSLTAMWVLFSNLKKQAFKSAKELVSQKFFWGATVLFLCALLSKPGAVMLPFITLLLVWCFFRDSFGAVRAAVMIWLCVVVPVALSTAASQSNAAMTYVTPLLLRGPVAGYSVGFYLMKIFLPLNLAPSYGFTPQEILQHTVTYVLAAVVMGCGVYLFLKREKFKFIFTGYFLFVLSLLPVTGIVTFYFQRYSNVADRYVYFGMIGMAIIATYLCTLPQKKIVFGVLGTFLAVCIFLTVRQVPVWKNEFSIWNDSMEKYPHQYMAAYNMGVYYSKNNQPELAINDYTVAIEYNGKSKDAFVNRANEFAKVNRFSEALKDYDAAIALAPDDGSIYYNRALMNYNAGNFDSCPPDILKAQELGFPIDMAFATAVRDAMHR